MASWLSFFFGLPDVRKDTPRNRPPPRVLPIRDNGLNPKLPDTPKLPALKNWSHPFKDSRDPLLQLTHMAKAAAGYYPLGRSGMFHGGVHFDGGTAGTLDQSSVHCLADGEVVAYRVDTRSPTTRYFVEGLTLDLPFSRNFVLVRHHLQAPPIHGSPDVPPSLTFYSFYMHLQDWAVYQEDPTLARPAFWPQSPIFRVKQTANDGRPGHPEEAGLNLRNADYQGKIIDLLPRGTEVVVSGRGYYRKLENRLGPSALLDADGALRGYIAASLLRPEADGEYRIVSSRERVNVRAEPSILSEILLELPTGTVLTVSGEGDFRKLERVNQYLYFADLESELAPQTVDQIVVLEQPVPIKAGALIGHIGDYQDGAAERPEQRLHLEVFSGDDIDLYFEASRAWAQRLPAKEKTWLKLPKGTAVVAHRHNVTGPLLRTWSESSPLSDADLLIPRSLLNGLPAEHKIQVPGRDGRHDRHWYRLDGLLHDAEQKLLNGWVCEEIGVTPTVSPWDWEGYDVLFDYSPPRHNTASFLTIIGDFTEAQCQRFKHLADKDIASPMKQRLYDIIDRNRDGHITANELQTALQLPAHAQAISQMVLRKESEWFYTKEKWDGLDELLGHCGSTPELNWVAEKQRIEQLGWWSEVAEKVGLPSWGIPYHFHPVGFITHFNDSRRKCYCHQQGLIEEPCVSGVLDVTKAHFELLATELNVEKEVLRAIAVAETGDQPPFREYEYGKRHALILYERHYMRRLLLAGGMSSAEVGDLARNEPEIVHTYQKDYKYGALDEQFTRLRRAREIDRSAAIKSCSWGKFQVMGEYYKHLYGSAEELEEAQNYCALQHLQYYKVFLVREKNLIKPMQDRSWTLIAQRYNGMGQMGYDVKIRRAYESFKKSW